MNWKIIATTFYCKTGEVFIFKKSELLSVMGFYELQIFTVEYNPPAPYLSLSSELSL